jgi:hypothetical protein
MMHGRNNVKFISLAYFLRFFKIALGSFYFLNEQIVPYGIPTTINKPSVVIEFEVRHRHHKIPNVSQCNRVHIYYPIYLQWPRGLRRGSAAARMLGLRVRMPRVIGMSVSCGFCVLSGRILWDGPITTSKEMICVQRSPSECGVLEFVPGTS